MRCDYCYNKEIVFAKTGIYTYNDILEFLKTRVGLLDAVVLSGGEATSHNLVDFCKEIKKLGFLIKLDTNGTNPKALKELIDLNLLNFIALDYKASKDKYLKITHSNRYNDLSNSLDILLACGIDFEVRTTLHYDLLDENDINIIIDDLYKRGYKNNYYIQNFLDTQDNIAGISTPKKSFDHSLLSKKLDIIFR
jgi:pyruvate formate lyase activating enzyme